MKRFAKIFWSDIKTRLFFEDLDMEDISSDVEFDTQGPFNVYIGNRELMLKHSIEIPDDADQLLTEHEEKGRTGIFIAINGMLLLVIFIIIIIVSFVIARA